MAKTSKIETALLEATSLKTKASEDRQDYFKRLIASVQELPEDAWEGLDESAQKWVNDGAIAGNAKKDISDFPDLKSVKEDAVATTKTAKTNGKDKAVEKKPAKKVKEAATEKKLAKKVKEPAAEKEAPAKKAKTKVKATRGSGLESQIKNLIIKKPAISADELVEKLTAKDVKASRFTVVAIRAGFRHSIKVLAEAGLIKGTIEL